MSRKFSRATSWIVQRRWITGFLILVISATAVGGYLAPDSVVAWFSSLVERKQVAEEDPNDIAKIQAEEGFQPPPAVDTIQTSGFDVIMLVESESFFTPRGADAIRSVVAHLSSLDYVDDILLDGRCSRIEHFRAQRTSATAGGCKN